MVRRTHVRNRHLYWRTHVVKIDSPFLFSEVNEVVWNLTYLIANGFKCIYLFTIFTVLRMKPAKDSRALLTKWDWVCNMNFQPGTLETPRARRHRHCWAFNKGNCMEGYYIIIKPCLQGKRVFYLMYHLGEQRPESTGGKIHGNIPSPCFCRSIWVHEPGVLKMRQNKV